MAVTKKDIINQIIAGCESGSRYPQQWTATGFAPSNIALIKYWGKRNAKIMLPHHSSLSVPLADNGTFTKITVLLDTDQDRITLDGVDQPLDEKFALRIINFLDLIRPEKYHFHVDTTNDIPTGAGVASSASGGAALVMAVDKLFGWELAGADLSIMARLVSGSAARSVYPHSFVYWNRGERADGMDCYATPLDHTWPELRIMLWMISDHEKDISSRKAMRNASSSPHYDTWSATAEDNIKDITSAINTRDFHTFGEILEKNARQMHHCIQTQNPPVDYFRPETRQAIDIVEKIRRDQDHGLPVYWTADAGHNLKLFCLENNVTHIRQKIRDNIDDNANLNNTTIQVIQPFMH